MEITIMAMAVVWIAKSNQGISVEVDRQALQIVAFLTYPMN